MGIPTFIHELQGPEILLMYLMFMLGLTLKFVKNIMN